MPAAAKVCKKRRLNLRFKNPLAHPVPCRSLRCVPYGWKFYARGIKCSIVSAPAPLPLTAPNAGVYASNVASHTGPAAFNRGTPSNRRRGRCPHRPAVRSGCFFRPAQGGRHPRRPVIDANAPTFQNMSGSGAEWQTILHLGHVLPKIPRIDRKGSQETNGFLRRSLVTFFRW